MEANSILNTIGQIVQNGKAEDWAVVAVVVVLAAVIAFAIRRTLTKVLGEVRALARSLNEFGKTNDNNGYGIAYESILLGGFEIPGRGFTNVFKVDPIQHIKSYAKNQFTRNLVVQAAPYISGIALFLTFLLIGIAVFQIGGSLSDTGPANGVGNVGARLEAPIQHLSFKFFVSAIGLIASIMLGLYRSSALNKIEEAIDQDLHFLYSKVTTRDASDVALQIEQAKGATETVAQLKRTNIQLESLDKLEVKVSDLSQSVLQAVATQITDELGKSMGLLLSQQSDSLKEIAEAMNKSLEASVGKIGEDLNQSFKAMSETLNKKSDAGVGAIVDKLETMLSGGTKQYGEELGKSLSGFGKLLPDLENSLNSMMNQMAAIAKDNAERAEKQNLVQEETLNSSLQKINEAIQKISATQTQSQEHLDSALNRIKEVSDNAVSAASSSIESVSTTMGLRLKEQTLESQRMIDRQMADMNEVSAIVNTVVASLRPILSELQPIMQNTSSIAIESKAAATQLRSVSENFKSVFDQTLELPKAVNAVNRDFNQTLSEQARMLAQNQASFKDLGETVGSGVSSALSVVRAGFEHSKNEIQHGQTQLAQSFGSKIESLSDSMEELNGSINKIVSLVKK